MRSLIIARRRAKLFPAALTAFLLVFPASAAAGAANGLRLCGGLVASLLPFMILSAWATGAGAFSGGKLTKALTRALFRLPPEAANALLSGWLCGYPAGVRAAAREYDAGALTKAQAERLLTFCACVSPQFAVSVIGVSLFGGAYAGVCVYAGALLSCLCVGVAGRFFARGEAPAEKSETKVPSGFAEAVADGTESVLKICALTVLFAAFIGAADGTGLTAALPETLRAALKTALEVTNGSAEAAGVRGGFIICAAGAGFGGVCVLCQFAALTKTVKPRLRLHPALLSRFVHAALTAVFASLLLRLEKSAAPVFSMGLNGARAEPVLNNAPAAVVLLALAATVLMKAAARRA